jgi:hypothetical protein
MDAEASGLEVVTFSALVGSYEPSSVPTWLGLLVLACLVGLSVPARLGTTVSNTSSVGTEEDLSNTSVGTGDLSPILLGMLDKLNDSGLAVGI